MLDQFLSFADAERVSRTMWKVAQHDVSRLALTGGLATEIHCLRYGQITGMRPVNDIDFIADSFDSIPKTLGEDFLCRHIHPLDPRGKTIAQFVDPETALRVDVFRAFGGTMQRTIRLAGLPGGLRLIALEDLAARAARLALDLVRGVQIPSKYARDFLRLAQVVNLTDMAVAWGDQRKANHPATFTETCNLLYSLIPVSEHLFATPEYSKDVAKACERCVPHPAFALADANLILALLGYC